MNMIASNLEDQPMDLSTGPRLESVIRSTTFYTPVAPSGGDKLTPTVPSPPTKRTYEDVRADEWESCTPASGVAHSVSSTSPLEKVKRQRLHSPENVNEGIGVHQQPDHHLLRKNYFESRLSSSSVANICERKSDFPQVSCKSFLRNDQTLRLRPNSEVMSHYCEKETTNKIQHPDSPIHKSRDDVRTPLEAWNETKPNDRSANTLDPRAEPSFNSAAPWTFENGAVCSTDGIYNAYMYLNYLPYILSESSSSETQRLNELLKMSSASKQAGFPPQAPTAISSIYSAYLASLLLPHSKASLETPVAAPSEADVPVASLRQCSTELLERGDSDASRCNRSRPAMQKCMSDPSGYLDSPESRLGLKPEYYDRKNSSNETFSHFHQKKQFVRASSFDDSLVRGHHSDELLADYDRKFAYSNWLQGYDVNKYNLLRANNSMPDLPSCSHDIPRQSPIASTSYDRLGDLVSRFDNPFNKIPSLRAESPTKKNTINIKNFNILRDLYSANDVNNFLTGRLRDQSSDAVEPPGDAKVKVGAQSPETRMNVFHQLCTEDRVQQTNMVPPPIPSNSKIMNGLMIKKKPTRALTGRHVRSGTGASISTLASLREKLEERKNRTPPSTPTSSRPTTRGRGRRKLPV